MSSGTDSGGVIALAVTAPVAIAFGAGWLAWQGGKLLYEANEKVNRQIADKKKGLAEKEFQKKQAAIAAYEQLKEICRQILIDIDKQLIECSVVETSILEEIRLDLQEILNTELTDDADQISSMASQGHAKLEVLLAKRRKAAQLELPNSTDFIYRGSSVADLMDDIKITLQTIDIQSGKCSNVSAANPIALERAKLYDELFAVVEEIINALSRVENISKEFISSSADAWFHSCFNGVDEAVKRLYMPSTSNSEIKKGIRRLKDSLDQFESILPSVEKDQRKFAALYSIYVSAAKALGDKVEPKTAFKNVSDLEQKLRFLQERAERAKKCSELYEKLGKEAYLCYAWDMELTALGYRVHARSEIEDLTGCETAHGKLGDKKLPFYKWGKDLTQLYAISEQCELQLVVHNDGTISLQTLSSGDDDVITEQKHHCSQLRRLHDNLRKNWFIFYDYEETASPETVISVDDYMESEKSQWKNNKRTTARPASQKRRESGAVKQKQQAK